MTTWWWVRHGPTHAKGMVGWRDLPADLSDQAALARLSTYLPQQALVVSSDLIRSVATADAIQGARQRLDHAGEIREMNFGDWDGMNFPEIAKVNPDLSRAYWSDPGDVAPPNGESWNETSARVSDFVDRLNRDHKDKHIVAVAHLGVILTQVQRASRMAARSALAFKIDNLSVTRLDYLDPHWRVHSVNVVP